MGGRLHVPLEPGAQGGEGVHGLVPWTCRGLPLVSVTAGPIVQMTGVRAGGIRAGALRSLPGVALNALPGLAPPLAPPPADWVPRDLAILRLRKRGSEGEDTSVKTHGD